VTNFSENLRMLCRDQPSVSKICREIGLNRQQFERYLQGKSQPSIHNTYRICRYFGVEESSLFLAPESFRASRNAPQASAGSLAMFGDLFPGHLGVLRNYIGTYHTHFINMTWPHLIQRALCVVSEENGRISTRYIGRVRDPISSQKFRSKFHGLMSVQGDHLFLLERGSRTSDALAQTILVPSERHSSTYVTGLTIAMAWRPHRAPFSTRIIWKRQNSRADYRGLLKQCGLFERNSRSFDPVIRSFFDSDKQEFLSV
jgi:transcriptional regulator with XRE-family HTH domain